jgi:hypothetical protein
LPLGRVFEKSCVPFFKSSRGIDELVDLALGLEPGDIAFDSVFMHFAE